VYPPTASGSLPAWVAVGGSTASVLRAARHGLPLMVAIIGGAPLRFAPIVELYRQELMKLGKPMMPVGVHSPGYVAATDEQARDEAWPHYQAMMARIGRERGWSPMTREQFELSAGPQGALFVGSPETVATKIIKVVEGLEVSRFDLKYSMGTLPHENLMNSISLYGKEVAPMVRQAIAEGGAERERTEGVRRQTLRA
jgi:alkanesulfonate monooxygenase SsuD/methylene tetrahydromethanopterin reductase-like flavin-dependent oxidoreductase (luciferase family)